MIMGAPSLRNLYKIYQAVISRGSCIIFRAKKLTKILKAPTDFNYTQTNKIDNFLLIFHGQYKATVFAGNKNNIENTQTKTAF